MKHNDFVAYCSFSYCRFSSLLFLRKVFLSFILSIIAFNKALFINDEWFLLTYSFHIILEKPQLDTIGKLKLLVTTTLCLKVFNPNLQACLKIDARSEVLGALLEQSYGTLTYTKWYPVGCVPRSLRDYEKTLRLKRKGKFSHSF